MMINCLRSLFQDQITAYQELYNELRKYYENSEFIIYGELVKRIAIDEGLYDDYVSVVDNKLGIDTASRQISQVFS